MPRFLPRSFLVIGIAASAACTDSTPTVPLDAPEARTTETRSHLLLGSDAGLRGHLGSTRTGGPLASQAGTSVAPEIVIDADPAGTWQRTKLTFEGVPNHPVDTESTAPPVPNVPTMAGAGFPGWLAHIDMDVAPGWPTHSGIFANAPSGITTIFWALDPSFGDHYRDIVFDRAVAEVTLQYTSCTTTCATNPFFLEPIKLQTQETLLEAFGSPAAFPSTGLAGDAGLVDFDSAPENSTNGAFDVWSQLSVADPQGKNTIKRVRIWGKSTWIDIDDVIFVRANSAPVVQSLSSVPASAAEGQPVDFVAAATDEDGDVLSYAWDFGDGTTTTTATSTTTHVYEDNRASNAAYTVQLTVTDPLGLQATSSMTIVVTNSAPVVTTPGTATTLANDPYILPVSIADAGTEDHPWSYTIDWGDGSTSSGTIQAGYPPEIPLAQRTHTYALSGKEYPITVTVTDKDGGIGGSTTEMVIGNRAPVAAGIDFSSPTIAEGQSVTVTGVASDPDGDVLAYCWSFASGCAAGASATASYPNSGSHLIELTVKDSHGASSDEVQKMLLVTNVAPTATFVSPTGIVSPGSFTLALTDPGDPSPLDLANLKYAFDCGSGSFSPLGSGSSISCSAATSGARTVRGRVTDGEDETTYTASFTVAQISASGTIEVQPQSVKLSSRGSAILTAQVSTSDLPVDVREIDPATVRLFDPSSLPAGNPLTHGTPISRKPNGAPDANLGTKGGTRALLQFDRDAMIVNGHLLPSTTKLMLRGRLVDGSWFEGIDGTVRVIP